ncbi:YciI family protein [Gordonia polyisoprenivorans]|uniref:YciI family protein n=1 Tax=Gordonia polyisoprenivorans TaxID=84595 RepID=UPI002301D767|nr:YciI family protein [Gordonia polyisoprenivorans]WCB36898.1 YciI family protein [Gordonia polyisoprenivorans]
MIVCLGTFTRPIGEGDADVIAEHHAFIDARLASGELVCSGPRIPATGGLIIFRGTDPAVAREVLNADPLVRDGVATYDITAFRATTAVDAAFSEAPG